MCVYYMEKIKVLRIERDAYEKLLTLIPPHMYTILDNTFRLGTGY